MCVWGQPRSVAPRFPLLARCCSECKDRYWGIAVATEVLYSSQTGFVSVACVPPITTSVSEIFWDHYIECFHLHSYGTISMAEFENKVRRKRVVPKWDETNTCIPDDAKWNFLKKMWKKNGFADLNEIHLICVEHTEVCVPKDLFISVDPLWRKIVSILDVKSRYIFIYNAVIFFIGIDVD